MWVWTNTKTLINMDHVTEISYEKVGKTTHRIHAMNPSGTHELAIKLVDGKRKIIEDDAVVAICQSLATGDYREASSYLNLAE